MFSFNKRRVRLKWKAPHAKNRNWPSQSSARLREISLLEINKHVGLYVLEGEYGIFYFILGELHSWD